MLVVNWKDYKCLSCGWSPTTSENDSFAAANLKAYDQILDHRHVILYGATSVEKLKNDEPEKSTP